MSIGRHEARLKGTICMPGTCPKGRRKKIKRMMMNKAMSKCKRRRRGILELSVKSGDYGGENGQFRHNRASNV
jgi:hypothetical protein